MGLEVTDTIAGLVGSNPTGDDPTAQGDDHLRLLKITLKHIFPGVALEGFAILIISTEEELNWSTGLTDNIQIQLDAIIFDSDAALAIEIAARIAGDDTLQLAIDNEIIARIDGDEALDLDITNEIAARTAADLVLQGNIDAEAVIRLGADDALALDIAGKEPLFSKNSGFNKNYGNVANTVQEGDYRQPASETGYTPTANNPESHLQAATTYASNAAKTAQDTADAGGYNRTVLFTGNQGIGIVNLSQAVTNFDTIVAAFETGGRRGTIVLVDNQLTDPLIQWQLQITAANYTSFRISTSTTLQLFEGAANCIRVMGINY